MDLSKLPRMSQTPTPPPQDAPDDTGPKDPAARRAGHFSDQSSARIEVGAEAWFSLAIGLIILFVFNRLLVFLMDPSTTRFDAVLLDGSTLPYLRSVFFPYDLGATLFGLALVAEGLVLFLVRTKTGFMAAMALMFLAVIANLWALAAAMPVNGFQIVPALFVAIGIYVALQQWRMIKVLSA